MATMVWRGVVERKGAYSKRRESGEHCAADEGRPGGGPNTLRSRAPGPGPCPSAPAIIELRLFLGVDDEEDEDCDCVE